jgi:hypothetical protein
MSIDFDAIATALVARFAPGAVTPPTGYDNIRVSTAAVPNQMTPLPTVLVFLDDGEIEYFPGKRDSTFGWLIRFYYNQTGDLERDSAALRKWATVLIDQLQGAVQLGGTVTSAHITGFQVGLLNYAGIQYTGLEMRITVITNDAWAAVA